MDGAGSDMADGGDDRTGNSRWVGLAQMGAVVVIVLVALYFMRAPQVAEFDDVVAEGADAAPRVNVVLPSAGRQERTVELTGTVRLRGSVQLRSQVHGRVVRVSPKLRNGGMFKAGDVLLKVDPEDHEIEVRAAEAWVEAQRARMRKHELQGQLEAAEYRRQNPCQPVPAIIEHEPQIARFKARVDRAEARLDAARLALERTDFSLPFDGKIIGTEIAVGDLVGPAALFGSAYARDAVEVEAAVALDDLAGLVPVVGRTAEVRLGARAFPAAVERVSSVVAPRSRMATLFLEFADDVSLEDVPPPGVFVEVSVHGEVFDNAFVLPDAAEQHDGTVWVVEAGALRSVSTSSLGRSADGWIVAAFDARDGVVLGAVPGAKDGLAVEPAPSAGL